jgi:hypothetical protein
MQISPPNFGRPDKKIHCADRAEISYLRRSQWVESIYATPAWPGGVPLPSYAASAAGRKFFGNCFINFYRFSTLKNPGFVVKMTGSATCKSSPARDFQSIGERIFENGSVDLHIGARGVRHRVLHFHTTGSQAYSRTQKLYSKIAPKYIPKIAPKYIPNLLQNISKK